MMKGKAICPAGGRRSSTDMLNTRKKPGFMKRLRSLVHTAPAVLSGNSGEVMDKYIEYRREQSGS